MEAPLSLLERALPGLPAAACARVAMLFGRQSCAKAELLLHQGGYWDHAVLIEAGMLRMFVIDRDGREFNKNFHAEGTLLFPLTPAMERERSLFSMAALEDSVLWIAPIPGLRDVLQDLGYWDALRLRLLQGLLTHKLQREHDLVLLDGGARYRKLCDERPDLVARVPLVHLASFLGMTDVSLSRIRRQARDAALKAGHS